MKTTLVYISVTECETPPLGVPYISSCLKNNNHEVSVSNFIEIPSNKKYKELGDSLSLTGFTKNLKIFFPNPSQQNMGMQKLLHQTNRLCEKWSKKILNTGADVIGFSTFDKNSLLNMMLAKKIKESNRDNVIVFGGPDCARWIYGNFYIRTEWVDAVVTGEGELITNKLISKIEKNKKIKTCKGCLIKNNGYIHDGGDFPLINNLDSLPFPDFSDFKLAKYKLPYTLPMITTRGCPFNCMFCGERLHGYRYRERSIKNVIREFKFQKKKHDVSRFLLWDSTINANPKRLSELCNEIIKEKLDIRWGADARATSDLSLDVLKKMYKAGCRCLHFGIESGSQRVLNLMKKGTNVKDMQNVLKWTKEAEILTLAYFVVGYPGETDNDAKKTLEFLEKNYEHIDTFFPSKCVIMPHTRLEEKIRNSNMGLKIKFDNGLRKLPGHIPMERRNIYFRYDVGKKVNFTEKKERVFSTLNSLKKEKNEKEIYGVMYKIHNALLS